MSLTKLAVAKGIFICEKNEYNSSLSWCYIHNPRPENIRKVKKMAIIETCNVFKSSKQLTLFLPATGNNVDCSYLHQRICLETHKSLYNGHVHTPLGQQCGLLPSGGVNMATLLPAAGRNNVNCFELLNTLQVSIMSIVLSS